MSSTPRQLSKFNKVINFGEANNNLLLANAVVFPDGTVQTTAGVAVDAVAREVANTASANTVILQGVNATQNTNITEVNQFAASAYNKANTATNLAQEAFNQANTATIEAQYEQGVNQTQNTSISILQSVNTTQNTRLDGVEGVNAVQNTNITHVNEFAQGAYNQANTNASNISIIESVNTWQNTEITFVNQFTQGAYNTANGANGLAQGAYDTANGANGLAQGAFHKANLAFASTGGTITGNVIINGNLDVSGNIVYTGNVTTQIITGNSGQFFGNTATGFEALYAGIATGYDFQPYTVFQVTSNSDSYAQINHQNINAGTDASTDLVATADNGNEDNTFIDMGINSSNYDNPDFDLTGPNDGYVYVHGNTNTGGGNLILATMHENDIIFAVQGQKTENEVMRVTSSNNLVIKTGSVITPSAVINGKNWQSVEDTQNTNISIIQGVDTWQNTQITFVDSKAQAAFDKANTGGSGGGLASWNVVTSNYTVGNNIQLIANTDAGTFTITLPSSPVLSNVVVIADGSSNGWSNNVVTVDRNGSTIEGYADNLELNVSKSKVELIYDGGTWRVVSSVGPKGNTGATGPIGPTGNTGPQGAGANATQRNYRFVATNNQTIFVGADAYGESLSYNVSAVSVYLNGVFLRPTDDYIANNSTTIYLNSGAFANDALDVVAFESMSLTAAQNTITTFVYTASAGQTSFGGADINGNVLDYNYNNIFVTLNGLTLRRGVDYLESNTSYIALTSGANANDEVSIVAFGSFSVQGMNTQNTISTYYYTSTAGQTNFTGADIYGNTLSYMQDGLFVVRNGATLRNKIDYTATNGTSVSLANPTSANDEIAITAVGWFSVAANGYTQVEANNLFLNKTDANTVFLPRTTANTVFLPTTGGSVTGNTYFSANTFFNSTIFTHGIIETANIITTPIGANTNFDIITQAVQYYTANAASNTTINIRGNSDIALNSLMNTGNSASIVLLFTNGSANTYYPNVIQIDGTPVTPKWQSGTTVTGGNASAIDVYGYTIIKTGNATYTVLASQTKFT